jgi:hypothetical protein
MKTLSIIIDDSMHQKVKLEATKKNQNIKEFILELLNQYFEGKGEQDEQHSDF